MQDTEPENTEQEMEESTPEIEPQGDVEGVEQEQQEEKQVPLSAVQKSVDDGKMQRLEKTEFKPS